MDRQRLSSLLQELLMENDKVAIKGLGGFFIEIQPSYFSDDHSVIFPPRRKVYFRTSIESDENLVENLIAKKMNTPIEDANEELSYFISELKKELEEIKIYELPGLGYLRATKQNNYFFVEEKNSDAFTNNYKLEEIAINLDDSVFDTEIEFTEDDILVIANEVDNVDEEQEVKKVKEVQESKEWKEWKQDEATSDEDTSEETLEDETLEEEVLIDDVPVKNNDTIDEEKESDKDAQEKEGTLAENLVETPTNETTNEEVPTEETTANDTPDEETTADEEATDEEAPADEKATAEETPAAEKTPAEKTTANDTPDKETTAEEAPADEETTANDTPDEETTADEEATDEEAPADEKATAEETTANDTPTEETTSINTPKENSPEPPVHRKKSGKIWKILLAIVVVAIIVVALLVLLADEISPLLDQMLYTKEELKLINSAASTH